MRQRVREQQCRSPAPGLSSCESAEGSEGRRVRARRSKPPGKESRRRARVSAAPRKGIPGDDLLSRTRQYHRRDLLNDRVRNGNGCDQISIVTGGVRGIATLTELASRLGSTCNMSTKTPGGLSARSRWSTHQGLLKRDTWGLLRRRIWNVSAPFVHRAGVVESPGCDQRRKGQANRPISTGRLRALLLVHRRPINVVVFHGADGDI
jgi:hypothetical protein